MANVILKVSAWEGKGKQASHKLKMYDRVRSVAAHTKKLIIFVSALEGN